MKKQYIAPSLTVVPLQVERGYAASVDMLVSPQANKKSEMRVESSDWNLSDDESFWNNSSDL